MRRDRDIASPLCRQSCSFQNANKVGVKLPNRARQAVCESGCRVSHVRQDQSIRDARLARVQFLASAKLTSKLGLRHATNCNEPEEMKKNQGCHRRWRIRRLVRGKVLRQTSGAQAGCGGVTLISRENFILFTPMLHESGGRRSFSERHRQPPSAHSSSREVWSKTDVQDVDLKRTKNPLYSRNRRRLS